MSKLGTLGTLQIVLERTAREDKLRRAVLFAAKVWRLKPNTQSAARLRDAVDRLLAFERDPQPPEASAAAKRRA